LLLRGGRVSLTLVISVLAAVFRIVTGGTLALGGRRDSYATSPWRGLSIAFAFLLLALALLVYFGRYERLFDDHTIFGGVTYTDAHVMLTGLLVVCAALVVGAVIAVGNAVSAPRGHWLAAATLPAVACYVVLQVVGWYV